MSRRLDPKNMNLEYRKVDFLGTKGCLEMHQKILNDQM
jgi:hypothetical protein